MQYQAHLAMLGKQFKAASLEEAYRKATLLRKRVNQYFDWCDAEGKRYSVPGLGLFLGLRTNVIRDYRPSDDEFQEHKLIIDYALQRVEAYIADRLFETRGSTKGTEFLLQNTLGYAQKSEVNSKQEVEISEKERIKNMPDNVLEDNIIRLVPKINALVKPKPDQPPVSEPAKPKFVPADKLAK